MTAIERTAYPRLKAKLSHQELEESYQPTEDEIFWATHHTHSDLARGQLLILLKVVQHLGYFPKPDNIPNIIIAHISQNLPQAIDLNMITLDSNTRYRYYPLIREYLQIKRYNQGGEAVAIHAIQQAALTMDNPADLINVALEELVRQRFLLPAYSTINRLVGHLRRQLNDYIYQQIKQKLSSSQQNQLIDLLAVRTGELTSDFNQLKQVAGPPKLTEMRRMIHRIDWLDNLLNTGSILAELSPKRVKRFAAEAHALEINELKDMQLSRQLTLLVCLLYQAQVGVRDQLVEIFIKRMSKIHNTGKEALDLIRKQQRAMIEAMIDRYGQIVYQTRVTDEDKSLGYTVRDILTQAGDIDLLYEDYEAVAAYHDNNYYRLLPRSYHSHRRVLLDMINTLNIQPTIQDKSLHVALTWLRENSDNKAEWIPASFPLPFINAKWQKIILRDEDGQQWYHRQHLEVCLFSYLSDALKSGDFFVAGSEDYADYREQLLSWQDCLPHLDEYCRTVGLPNNDVDFVAYLKNMLHQAAQRTNERFPDNPSFSFDEDGIPTLKRGPSYSLPVGFKTLRAELVRRMPSRSLLEILTNLEHWLKISRHFAHVSGSDAKFPDAQRRYLVTLFAYGSNLGPAQTAKHLQYINLSTRIISLINRQHTNTEKLDAIIRDIIHHYQRLDLPNFWGTNTSAAADGTQFDLYRNNLLAERHIRYGGYGGIAYHHVSDTYIALFSHFIACGVWEAVYIIDGLLKNESDIQPDTLHADTQGQNEPVFGLSHLLGIKLMPRIRNWKDLKFYRYSPKAQYSHINPIFNANVNWRLIQTHWQELMRVVLSIRAGKLMPSTILRKLGTYSRQNSLYLAFRELGRVIRTVFLLNYLSNEELRRQIQSVTTRIEAYNGFSKWLVIGKHGTITTNDPIEQEKRIKYIDVLANAVIIQNAVDMTHVLRELAAEGYTVTRETISYLSPYLTEHIRRFGQYRIDMELLPPPIQLDEPLLDTH